MNQHIRPDTLPIPLEGVTRRKWTGDDVLAMVRAGILHEGDRIELLAGEIVAMPSKGARHEIMRTELNLFWARRLPVDVKFAAEAPLKLAPHDEPEPDLILFPASMRVPDVRGDTVLLVVEIADSSLSYDLNVKAPRFAAFGVREYWVIDPIAVRTTVHLDPSPEGYRHVTEMPGSELLTPVAAPSLAVRLTDLDIG
jgi:Uma2 family endonuclease